MTGKQLKIKLLELDLNQLKLAEKLGVSIVTVNTMCNRDRVPMLWQWAIYGLEFEANKGVK